MIGEGDLTELDRLYLQFGEAFETSFIAQRPNEDRSIVDSLDRGWRLLDKLPESELTRVSVDELHRYGRRGR